MARTKRRKRRRRGLAVGLVLTLVVAGLGGYAYLDITDQAPGVLTDDPPWPEAEPYPDYTPPIVADPADVPGADPDAPLPTADALAALTAPLFADDRVGPTPGVSIVDVLTGEELYASSAANPYVPASTLKLLTGVAVLETFGDQHTFTTEAVLGDDGTVTLVAGGDITMAADVGDPDATIGHAGLGDLAEQVATELLAQGRTEVTLTLDDTLFTGPTLAPDWGEVDLAGGWAMPIAPLAVNLGIVDGVTRRQDDAALAAAQSFATALAARGVTVTGDVTRAARPQTATVLGSVASAPLRDIVAYMMQHSDNVLAEVLGRMTAVQTGQEASFLGAGAAVLEVIAGLGVDVTGAQFQDTSGLSRDSTLTPRMLTDTTVLIAGGTHPELLAAVQALPVAHLEGTLADRLGDTDAAGTLAAKTGTLPQAVALAGLVTTADGRLLAFSALANGFPAGAGYQARMAIDTWAAGLAACGCT
ncbi:D-alanyl-D-alanine carboxypeptidase/D-alanyl-D-alanine endopeptidase [Occultella gossypii]|uniref:D-alanyl-D-alanine carboxypeptidase/D-alanyl-D-alanine-endopeptidase n=1 Tax=Occultella gossypii TaxID=2800820 RepID=A0ABS7SBG9_9MICO|nr:D-alanyl-D-alanine carboxypeptidase/D-alanyl-D-alanine-endopeptidase [Occultella gossypii]MBZ2197218.1 D-alanyl-D-alanine carboxypeptidase/D-alanyl-D-alanine-endopeptidase [Occultella gossypii]